MDLVIDADIARSSGLTVHPVSSTSRNLLDSILNSSHNASFCRILLDEWNKHQSAYTRKWRVSMYSRKKIKNIVHEDAVKIRLEQLPESKERNIALKDSHLIDIALLTDKIIFSNDLNAKNSFSNLLKNDGFMNEVYWLSPLENSCDITEFVIKGRIIPEKHLVINT